MRARSRLDTLHADPTMQDANRLEGAARDVSARRNAMRDSSEAAEVADRRLTRRIEETGRVAERATQVERKVSELRRESAVHADAARIADSHAGSPLAELEMATLVRRAQVDFDRACTDLYAVVRTRREQIALLRGRHAELERAEAVHGQRRQLQDERQADAETAAEQRTRADTEVDRQGLALVEDWERHSAELKQLTIDSDEGAAALAALADWVVTMQGDNPARRLLQAAQQRASQRLAERGAVLDGRRRAADEERRALEEERDRLEAGIDRAPPAPYTRGADVRLDRQGAPLWQLLDFRDTVPAPERAGLEAALEAAGLLDAWVSRDGCLQSADGGSLLHDTLLLQRRRSPFSLAEWLQPSVPDDVAVSADMVAQLLSGIACGSDDDPENEAWISPDGRFRLGALAGAWAKPAAAYIGHTARAAARRQRLAEIAGRLKELAAELAAIDAIAEQVESDRRRAHDEWRLAPADEALRTAHAAAVAAAREAQRARERLAEADLRRSEAEQALKAARERLAVDAADLRLPEPLAELAAVDAALDRYRDLLALLIQAVQELRLALPELDRQRLREQEARDDLAKCGERLVAARNEAEEAAARLEVLRDAVGAKVEELQRKLSDARLAVEAGDDGLKRAATALRQAGEARAVSSQQAESTDDVLKQRTETRAQAVGRLQEFSGTGLLSSALPHLEMPDLASPWTIDPALTLARRIEQALSELKDDDDAWTRVQRQINDELAELQRSLSALGHQAPGETSDWGLIVRIVYRNRPERPDRLAASLAEEIAQRGELLTAKERAVLENHLQGAERQLDAINKELHKRPTSTGVRYRLLWQPLAEEEGAPLGLDVARKRLLNTSSDLWSADDRTVVGTMLQQRIAAESDNADAGADTDGSLLDQLARALDYRRWHRFRVERWQDGQWRKLSGPASSGERALGLTVPLFAAVASFYSQGGHALAPRMILLDEAFAGIDDAARAHCMGLIREFDFDFVITSEREWACYAELPGVAICQLQRREGIDAVFVSRWTWDGRARVREDDPDRRFAPE